ncbi:MAG: glycosyltransferase family 4 protein [Thermoleophilaceae bacterium]
MSRIAYVLERYPELSQTFVEDELRELARIGDEPHVLALAPGAGAALAEPHFAPLYPPRGGRRLAPAMRLALARPNELARRGAWPSDRRHLRGLARIAAWRAVARRADHLHAHFATEAADIAALLGRLAGKPHSFTGHSTDLFSDAEALRRRLDEAAFAVLVCDYDRREVERLAPGHGRPEVVPLGVDLERFSRTTPYAPDGPILAVGRLVEHKGFADLAAVAAELGRQVVIAGAGPEREVLARSRVTLPGALAPREAAKAIERASVLVAPSVIASDGSRDGIPMVVKEALALEVPVVASDGVGNAEVVAADRGALYPAGDRRALADAIGSLLGRPPDERAAMGRAGRAFAEREADLRKQTARLRELFRPR